MADVKSMLSRLVGAVASALWPTTDNNLKSDYLYINSDRTGLSGLRSSTLSKIDGKNTYAPYLNTYTDKSLRAAERVKNKIYEKISNGFGSVVPSDWANTRAGDPNYTKSQQAQVIEYLENPKNGWTKSDGGVYTNDKTGQVYSAEVADMAANTPVSIFKADGLDPVYNGLKRFITVPDIREGHMTDVVKFVHEEPEVAKQGKGSIIHEMSSTKPTTLVQMSPKQLDNVNDTLAAVHEVNHSITAPVTATGLVKLLLSDNKKSDDSSGYTMDPVELHNAASLFQQQTFDLTGHRLTNKETMMEDIDKAKENIEDYDPESRRFLQSVDILENKAKDDPEAADMLTQIVEAMPVITKNEQIPGYDDQYKKTLES